VEVLVGLGLSGRQARVYLGLRGCGGGCVREVAVVSGVHRQEVYRLLEGLLELGLVCKSVSVPVRFRAVPVGEAVRLLLLRKSGQVTVLRRQTKWLIKKYSEPAPFSGVPEVEKPCFGIVHESDRGKKYLHAIKASRKSICAVTSWRRFKQLSIHFENQLTDALTNGLELRVVTEKPSSHHLPKWVTEALGNYQSFEVKTVIQPPAAGITIFDENIAAIAFNPNDSLTKGPDLWTQHPALLAQGKAYFNAVWQETKLATF
jgi:sugar-specific transcriptional regulator TrmB